MHRIQRNFLANFLESDFRTNPSTATTPVIILDAVMTREFVLGVLDRSATFASQQAFFLSGRAFSFSVVTLDAFVFGHGVTQGSVLGPFFFNLRAFSMLFLQAADR